MTAIIIIIGAAYIGAVLGWAAALLIEARKG